MASVRGVGYVEEWEWRMNWVKRAVGVAGD